MDFDPILVRDGLIVFFLLVASIVFHEWGHAVMADLLGDETPRADGRVTLNPLAHLDMVGTLIVPLINIFVFRGGFTFIGWGKPVMTHPSNFANRVRDDILVSLAGPAANLFLALISILAGTFLVAAQPRVGELVNRLVVMNVGLAVFNMLPIPPLDGASLLRRIVGMPQGTYTSIARWSGVIILIAINLGATRQLIGFLVGNACVPYALLCRWISPSAFPLIFPS
jgi:Zn-dependent protease